MLVVPPSHASWPIRPGCVATPCRLFAFPDWTRYQDAANSRICGRDGMVDISDLKSVGRMAVWVRVPPPAPKALCRAKMPTLSASSDANRFSPFPKISGGLRRMSGPALVFRRCVSSVRSDQKAFDERAYFACWEHQYCPVASDDAFDCIDGRPRMISGSGLSLTSHYQSSRMRIVKETRMQAADRYRGDFGAFVANTNKTAWRRAPESILFTFQGFMRLYLDSTTNHTII